jgi:GTP cyclohydrolase I
MRHLSWQECQQAAGALREQLLDKRLLRLYGVPRGGVPVALLLYRGGADGLELVHKPEESDVVVDDIVDSGRTRDRFTSKYGKPFFALTDFLRVPLVGKEWIVFPWEGGWEGSAEDIVYRLLEFIGEDPKREGLAGTPARVLNAWKFWCQGYSMDPASVLTCFEDGAEQYDEMVIVKGLPFFSHCEHHLAPFFGTATIGYIPSDRIVGLSKLGRVLDIYARRLQVQERLTTQIAEALQKHLDPKGVGVYLRARHLCMESRGLSKQGHETVTCALKGVFRFGKARQEFLSSCV